ncbi:SF1B family DNA helicase RecD2 [Streptococcus fryi]
MAYYFTGSIERVIFENSTNFFKIILLNIDDTDSDFNDFEIIVTGTIGEVFEGDNYTFWGDLSHHPKYGEQLKVTRYEKSKPSSSALIKYFASDHFKGVGVKTAERIVSLYGENTIDDILADPSKLDSISGFSKVARDNFIATLKVNYGTEQIITTLVQYGLSNRLAFQIFEQYKEETLTILNQNPYQLVEDIKGIGFKMADKLAEELGIESNAPERLRAGLIHTLFVTCLEEGDTYLEARDLLEKSLLLLEDSRQIEISPEELAGQLSQLISEEKVKSIGTKIFENSLYYAEFGIHKHLNRLLDTSIGSAIPLDDINQVITAIEDSQGINYDAVQKEAIQTALNSKVFILTGGPGTGKTTVINGIIEAYAQLHNIDLNKTDIPILLAAPTGRAARRMSELTGLPSATIHRHLGLNTDNDYQVLDDYLDADLIIIDEFSMVDTWLAHQLLSAISSHTQVIIVGDADQLPSVGPGQVLADLLNITTVPQIALKKIFRQSEDSTIVTLANQINSGKLPDDFTEKKPDRSYFEADASYIPDMILKIVSAALKSGIPKEDIQILAPMYRGQSGITHLNAILQNTLNPKEEQLEFIFQEQVFRENDKVLHLINDAEQNVFNGDIGYIKDLIPAKYTESKQDEMVIQFDDNQVTYSRQEWGRITLAYAMSIHKSQGSEFKVVILPITKHSQRMLQRNLIYTAITRAKSKLIMLGDIRAFDYATRHEGTARKTYLKEHFWSNMNLMIDVETVTPNDTVIEEEISTEGSYVLTEENITLIDPLIGLTELDFAIFSS